MPTQQNTTLHKTINNERVLSIDILRGFLLTLMVFVHFILYFGDEDATNTFTYFFFNDVLADWGAAAFLMMMGMSQVLSSKKFIKPDNLLLFKRVLLRGGYIFVLGLIMLILAWGPDKLWEWDILTLMGFATIILFFCRFLPSWFLIILCCAIALLTPSIRSFFNITADWGFREPLFISKYLSGMFLDPLSDYHPAIIKGFFLSGYFAVLPWIIFSIIGFILGRRIVSGKIKRDLPFLLITGVLLLSLGFSLAYMGRTYPHSSVSYGLISPICFLPDSFSMINIQAGMSIMVFAVAYFFYDIRKKDKASIGTVSRFFIRTSNFSLSFYFLHYMLIGWTLAILYLITGKYMFSDMLGVIPAFLCGIVAVIFLEILIFFWGKADSKYSLEWILTKLTTFVFPGYKRSINKF